MKIRNHRLLKNDGCDVAFIASPNIGGIIRAQYLVLHYTAGSSAAGTVAWFQNPASRVSAHLVIARDGTITQMVAFNREAYHAGKSQRGSIVGLNGHNLGIEIDNAGQLIRGGGKWISPLTRYSYPDQDVTVATHKNDPPGTPPSGWHAYTGAQIEALLDASLALVKHLALADVLGHDDIAPGRKRDPGPDFPMAPVRARLLGRGDDDDERYRTAAKLNIRSRAGTEFPFISGSPLALKSTYWRATAYGRRLMWSIRQTA